MYQKILRAKLILNKADVFHYIDEVLNEAGVSWPLVFEHKSKPLKRREAFELVKRRDALEPWRVFVLFVLF